MTCKKMRPMGIPCRCCAEREEETAIWIVVALVLSMAYPITLAFFLLT